MSFYKIKLLDTNIITKKACIKNLLMADLIIFKSEKKPKIKTANENDINKKLSLFKK